MFEVCCLSRGETKAELGTEVLYRRYLRFYLTFHLLYILLSLASIIAFYHESWEAFYIASFVLLSLDTLLIAGLLLRPEQGPDKRVIGIAFIMTFLSTLMYLISRCYALFSPDVSDFYSCCIVIFLMFFIFTKCRCMYHIYRFNRFNSFEKTTTRLAAKSAIAIDEESWTHEDIHNGTMSEVGAGNTEYVTMNDPDTIGDLQQSAAGRKRQHSMRSNRSSSAASDNSSLDLGNLHIDRGSLDSTKSSASVHEFCAVTGADTVSSRPGSNRSSIDERE